MTTILGVQYDDGFVMVADSQVTDNERPFFHPDVKKIVQVGEYTIGGAGTSALVDVVQSEITLPKSSEIDKIGFYKFLVGRISPAIRRLHEDSGYTPKESEGFEFIIGVRNQLFYMAGDYSIIRSNNGIYAIGTGAAYAVGAVAAGASPKQAVNIAIEFDVNSGGNLQIVKRGKQNA